MHLEGRLHEGVSTVMGRAHLGIQLQWPTHLAAFFQLKLTGGVSQCGTGQTESAQGVKSAERKVLRRFCHSDRASHSSLSGDHI